MSLICHFTIACTALFGRINRFQDIWDGKDFTNEEKNRLIKQIVREITYLREGDDLYIDIKFL